MNKQEIKIFKRPNWFFRLFDAKTYSVTLVTCEPTNPGGRCRDVWGVNKHCLGWRYKNLAQHPTEEWILDALRRDEYVNIPTAKVVK